MGYAFPVFPHMVFVPKSMALPKAKAKELRAVVEGLSLSEAQRATAQALGWADWFHLEQAVKSEQPPSLLDDDLPTDEISRRGSTQRAALFALGVGPRDIEQVMAQWGLTSSRRMAETRLSAVGPWGAFQTPPEQIAPGILFGKCAKFSCYRLSPERQAAMPSYLRINEWDGWYMAEDYGYRVVLSFSELFDSTAREKAIGEMYRGSPLVCERAFGIPPDSPPTYPLAQELRRLWEARPDEWFMLSRFETWTFINGTNPGDSSLCIVSAIEGRGMLKLLNELGVWPDDGSIAVRWLAVEQRSLCTRSESSDIPLLSEADSGLFQCLTGLEGYDHPPVAAKPFKFEPFNADELSPCISRGYRPLVTKLFPGVPALIT
jgi:hypothetical protein